MRKRRYHVPPEAARCNWNVILKDGSGAACMRPHLPGRPLCWQHARMADRCNVKAMKTEHLKRVQTALKQLEDVQADLQAELQKTQRVTTAIELGGLAAAVKALETVTGG
jgi:hypothetical protein